MSELSAKHKALNILQVLTRAESKERRTIKTSPRPDLSSSQEILGGKYKELATLLATQHVERKRVYRLQSVDLVSRSLGDAPRRQRYHDSQEKSSRRRCTKNLQVPNDDIPEVELSPCIKEINEETDSPQIKIDLKLPPNSLPGIKKVSFSDVKIGCSGDGYASSSTEVSDTEVIRRILQSPRRVITGEINTSPPVMTARRHKVSLISKKTTSAKKKPRKQKESAKQLTKRSPGKEPPEMQQTKKEFHDPSDHKLNSSSNPDVLSWLTAKNKLIRKQKRSERKKERQEQLAERKVTEEKMKKLVESEEKVTQWMKEKKVESLLKQRVERKVRKEIRERESLQHPVQAPPESAKTTVTRTQHRRNSTKTQKSPHSKENVAKDHADKEMRHHLVRNLEAERLHAEETRQAKESERRRRRLLREAQTAKDSKRTDSVSNSKQIPTISFADTNPDSMKATTNLLETNSKSNSKMTSADAKPKNRPSSNPFKGMTYDDWLKQKQSDQRKQAKEAKKQDVCDPELDDLIPLLARRRIEQIKIRSTRVDSGLRNSRNRSDPENTKPDKRTSPNGERPYTWKLPTNSASGMKPVTTKPGHFTKQSRSPEGTDQRKNKMASSMPDVINFVERPEPQGCEGSQTPPLPEPQNQPIEKRPRRTVMMSTNLTGQ